MEKKLTKIVSLTLALSMMASLAACGSGSTGDADSSSASSEPETSAATESTATESSSAEAETEAQTEDGSPVYGGTLVVYASGFHNEFDPSCATDRSYITYYLDSLWNLDWDVDRSEMSYTSSYINSNYLVGQVAKSWEIADDYTSMSVTIRDDVYFQDKSAVGLDGDYDVYKGRQVTASDVAYSYNRLLGLDGVELVQQELTTWTTDLACLDSVEVVDDTNLVFHFNTNDQLSVDGFMSTFVFICGPEWDALTDEQQTDWHYASGTGAFILTDYVTDNTMTFVANPNYWDTDDDGNQLPYLDSVKLVQINDSATALASFISGEVDILMSPGSILDNDQAGQLAAALSADDYVSYNYVTYPTAVTLKNSDNAENAPLQDERVREALQYAVDLDSISDYMGYTYESTEEALAGIFDPGTSWCDINSWDEDVLKSYTTYDPDYAKELLTEAGYGDGFSFDVYVFSIMFNDSLTLAAEQLKKVGVTMNVNLCSDIVAMVTVGEDSSAAGFSYALPNTGLFCTSVAAAVQSVRSDGGNNRMFQSADEMDDLVDALANATTLDEQIEAAKVLDNEVMSHHYFLLLTHNAQYTNYYRSYVKGLHGEQPMVNYFQGYMITRTWLEK